ncbi:MAG: E3 binding domain-containing protein, partial [Bdellovibrionales bacterium]|nr:E3 binding domain-containing protein [Bdellovibrionales bacterium]
MAFEFKLPEIGEGVTQGEIVKWLVKVGDAIGEDQPIVEIMTDKATVEIASPKAGQIEKLLAKEGDTIDVGSGLAQIKEGKNDATTQANGSHGNTKTDVKNTDKSPDRHEAKSKSMPEEKSSAMQDSLKHSSTAPQTSLSRDENQSILASPATRKFARENDISLATIQGSGPQGRVLMEDVVAFSKNPVQEVSSTAKRQIPNH